MGTAATAAAGGVVTTALLLGTGAMAPREQTLESDPPLAARSQLVAVAASAQGLSAGEIYRRAAPAVVSVRARAVREEPSPFASASAGSAGSGFVIDADENLVVCSARTVAAAGEVAVTLTDGTELPARTLGRDDDTDLALLAVDPGGRELAALELAGDRDVDVGDPTLALGNADGGAPTLTTGVISSPGRRLTADGGLALDGVLQTDAAPAPGDAGGPLLDAAGRVIGVGGLVLVGGSAVGYALPSATVAELVPELREAGRARRGFLGVLAEPSPGGRGVRLAEVRASSPAAAAGLRAGDAVRSIGGEAVSSVDDLAELLAAREPGETVDVALGRRTAEVRLGERPSGGALR